MTRSEYETTEYQTGKPGEKTEWVEVAERDLTDETTQGRWIAVSKEHTMEVER